MIIKQCFLMYHGQQQCHQESSQKDFRYATFFNITTQIDVDYNLEI